MQNGLFPDVLDLAAVNEPAKLGRNNSVKKNVKRPVSNIFMKAESGSVKNKTDKRGGPSPPVNILQALGSSPLASPRMSMEGQPVQSTPLMQSHLTRRMSLIETHLIVQTKGTIQI